MRQVDLMGKRFGKLTVIGKDKSERGRTRWRCKCDCGNEKTTTSIYLLQGRVKSCGCWRSSMRSSRFIDRTGQRFGKLTVVEVDRIDNGRVFWTCICDCGNRTVVASGALNATQSCGCTKKEAGEKRRLDLTGKRVGRLVVIKYSRIIHNKVMWECLCDCGTTTYVHSVALSRGTTLSCGCLQRERSSEAVRLPHVIAARRAKVIKFRYGTHPAIGSWKAMMARCYNPNNVGYKNYGAIGRSVCEEWHDKDKFVEWAIANGWKAGLTIDRIDNTGNYTPDNCQWIPMPDNSRKDNRSRVDIEIGGITYCISEWATYIGVPASQLYRIKNTAGLDALEAYIREYLADNIDASVNTN